MCDEAQHVNINIYVVTRVQPPTPPSPKGKAPPPKGKGPKGKEKTPEPVDPALQEKVDRAHQCKTEAMEGIRLAIVFSRRRIELIKNCVKKSIDECAERFSSTFEDLDDMIRMSFKSEMAAVDDFQARNTFC